MFKKTFEQSGTVKPEGKLKLETVYKKNSLTKGLEDGGVEEAFGSYYSRGDGVCSPIFVNSTVTSTLSGRLPVRRHNKRTFF